MIKVVMHSLGDGCAFETGRLPEELIPGPGEFAALWNLHPAAFPEMRIHGRIVKMPRWQAVYGADYRYVGRKNSALPVPECLVPLRDWCHERVDPRLCGLVVNWYDGALGHYIGPHSDDTRDLVPGVPIVIVSLGESRVFRLRPRGGTPYRDFEAANGSIFLLPYATNLSWTHEVPRFRRHRGRRISVTLRALRNALARVD